MMKVPAFLTNGDKVALVSPSYHLNMAGVEKAAGIIRSWGLVPVIGRNAGKLYERQYAGSLEERLSDLQRALEDPGIKAIICNRGGYGTIQMVSKLKRGIFSDNPKWIVGFSDITTLHEMATCAGVMSIQGPMCSFLANKGGDDISCTSLRDLLFGTIPQYQLPAHPFNRKGSARGTLVGGNLMTFAPLVGSSADATALDGIILFIEEVEESMHNIDRQINMLALNGVLDRVKGVILGEFTRCGDEFGCTAEELISRDLESYGIPVLCGFPAGHGDVILPLVMGSTVNIDINNNGASVSFTL